MRVKVGSADVNLLTASGFYSLLLKCFDFSDLSQFLRGRKAYFPNVVKLLWKLVLSKEQAVKTGHAGAVQLQILRKLQLVVIS